MPVTRKFGSSLRRKAIYGAISACVLVASSQVVDATVFTYDRNGSGTAGFGTATAGT